MSRSIEYIRGVCSLVCALFFATICQAAEPNLEDDFKLANVAYEQGNYKQAITKYRGLLTNGWRTPAIHFNLGNACFKAGQVGEAIYHYRKARELNPRDPDVKANLSFARDSIGAVDYSGLDNMILSFLKLGEILAIATFLFWSLFVLLGLRVWKPEWKFRINPWLNASLIGFLVAAVASYFAWQGAKEDRVAIVAKPEAIARFGPLPESQTAYTLRDGVELAAIGRKAEWVQVRDNRGRTAWLPQRDLLLFP
ncbi:MAG: tetratricopeptide repeat protein [Verrucomicrobiales bacterium]